MLVLWCGFVLPNFDIKRLTLGCNHNSEQTTILGAKSIFEEWLFGKTVFISVTFLNKQTKTPGCGLK